jgi:hypothetical protein
MKTKVKMTCILKSGVKITDTIKVDQNDKKVRNTITAMREEIERYMSSSKAEGGQITWGTTTIKLSEIAAITFKE